MAVTITDDLEWINVDHELDSKHLHNAVYLLREGDNYILVDTGSSYHEQAVKSEIARITGGDGIDAILLSKVHLPHAGSVREFLSEYNDPEVVITGGQRDLYGLPGATQGVHGETLEVAGREITLVDPPLVDVQHTTWVYDEKTGVLFAAEAFCHYHDPGECGLLSDEIAGGIDPRNIRSFHREMLVYLKYVDPAKVHGALGDVFDRYDISMIAPIHGNPVVEDDIDDYVEIVKEAVTDISRGYQYPSRK